MRSRYEWDPNKAATNLQKHKVSFDEAVTVLQSQTAVVFEDRSHSEDRFVAIGFSIVARILLVVYCHRDKDTIRLISARKATKREREQYEKGI
jgi:uncharacterized DUF497 family protein